MKTISHYLRHRGTLVMLVAAVLALSVNYRGDIRKVHAEDAVCTLQTLHGNFGFTGQALLTFSSSLPAPIGSFVPLAESGVFTSDGEGNLFGSSTVSFGGQIFQDKFSGPYTVNADCTGSTTLTSISGGTTHFDFVLDDHAEEVHFVGKDAGVVATVNARKQ